MDGKDEDGQPGEEQRTLSRLDMGTKGTVSYHTRKYVLYPRVSYQGYCKSELMLRSNGISKWEAELYVSRNGDVGLQF